MYSLTDLPLDVTHLIASYVLPYDVLSLTSTSQKLRHLLYERTLWLQIADSVSRSRPLPFTAAQALDLSTEELISSCLRAQRVAQRWSEPNIYPRMEPVKIRFPDNRIIVYFTFLPGSRHLMVHDAQNIVSCWTTDGSLLDSWRVPYGAKLTRWKPCDNSENTYEFQTGRVQAIEIMIEQPVRAAPTRCEIVLLIYSGTQARFESVSQFTVPRVFEPFSAMTQDELRGSLVKIDIHPSRVGIYLIDKNTEKAICIDTGLRLLPDRVPQALLSSSLLVLYWETISDAYSYTYDMDILRSVLAHEGLSLDDSMLRQPIKLEPSDTRTIPFRTINVDTGKAHSRTCGRCRGCGAVVEQSSLPSTDLSNNREAYPVIIPKWHTLREDLKRHRTRSVLSFSRRMSRAVQAQAQALALYVNAPDLDTMHVQLLDETGNPVVDGGIGALHDAEAPAPNSSSYHVRGLPRTTITHHYFDYSKSLEDGPVELVRTVLADAPLRRPRSLHLHWHRMGPVVMEGGGDDDFFDPEVEIEEIGVHQGFGDEVLDEDDLIDGGLELEGMGVVDFGGEEDEQFDDEEDQQADEQGEVQQFDQVENDEHYDNNDDHDNIMNHHGYPQTNEGIDTEEVGELQQDLEGLGLDVGEHENHHHHAHAHRHGTMLDLTPEAAQALADILQDPFGGSPVMGYGGRCAMWVEEHPMKYRANGRAPVLRVATFPTYKPPEDDRHNSVPVHPELEISHGRVGTLHLPGYIALESSYTFDLDDVRGIVGVATLFGELWLVDFS